MIRLVIASEAKQSSFAAATKTESLRRFVPRNDGRIRGRKQQ